MRSKPAPKQLLTTARVLILLSLQEVPRLLCTLSVSVQLPSPSVFCQISQVSETNSSIEAERSILVHMLNPTATE